MAYVTTFDSLQEDVRQYLERGFTAEDDPFVYTQLPRLINRAERKIARELKIQGFITAVNTTFQQGVSVYNKPDRWRDTVSISLTNASGKVPVFARSYEYCRNYWPNAAAQDQPEFYADYDYSHWLIVPTPDADYSAEILYYAMPPLLDETNQTNWLSAFAPNLLLYGTLLESTVFLKNDDRVQTWQAFYDREAQAVKTEDLSKILDREAVRAEA
jgi:hypothetical protein